jgi:hypothetical protein
MSRRRVLGNLSRRQHAPPRVIVNRYDGPKSQSDKALKVRFSATLGEEPEVEVGLV